MTILLLTHSYPDEVTRWRGSFIREQAMALSGEHTVVVVYFRVDYSRFSPFGRYHYTRKEDGNLTHYVLTSSRSFPVINQIKYLRETYKLIKEEILSKQKIDIIHSHLSYPGGFLGTILQIREKIPNVLNEHSWITNYFRTPVHRRCALFALRRSDCVITVSTALKNNLAKFTSREIVVVPNVVNFNDYIVSTGNENGILNIGIMGSMNSNVKGIDILLKSLTSLDDMNILLHIGGTGRYLEEYKNLAKDLGLERKCVFYGEIESDRKSQFYGKLDVYILSSRSETFGMVVVEAMACGLPVIATRCGGPEEIVTAQTGILTEKENPAALAAAIRQIAGNIGLYDRNFIRSFAVKNYGPENFTAIMTTIYSNLLNKT
jgi:glycosyltransferase involved in cell wall biosynthesis